MTCSDAYASLMESNGSISWGKSIWASYIPLSCSFLLWRIFHGKLPTEEAFSNRGIYLPSCCRLCFNDLDNVHHIFLECSFAKAAWEEISSHFKCRIRLNSSIIDLWSAGCMTKFSAQLTPLWHMAIISVF